jgi:hypothetical protein
VIIAIIDQDRVLTLKAEGDTPISADCDGPVPLEVVLSGNRGLRIEDVMSSTTYAKVGFTKYCIPSNLYEGVFALLRKMNITSKSLYGNLDGLARSIHMQMKVFSI